MLNVDVVDEATSPFVARYPTGLVASSTTAFGGSRPEPFLGAAAVQTVL